MHLVHLLDIRLLTALRQRTFLIEHAHDAHARLDQRNLLTIVRVGYVLALDALALVVLLLQLDEGVNELLLQLLVRVIDAELLERVELEILRDKPKISVGLHTSNAVQGVTRATADLKAEYIEKPNEKLVLLINPRGSQRFHVLVESSDEPIELVGVNGFGQSVARVNALRHRQRHSVGRSAPGSNLARDQ